MNGHRQLLVGSALVVVLAGASAAGLFFLHQSQPAVAAEAIETTRKSVMTVKVATPVDVEWPQIIKTSGPIAAWQEAVVGAEIGGYRVSEVNVDVGDKVAKGQVLAKLADDSVLADMRKQEAAVAQAKASLKQAQANAARARKVKGSGALSEQQIEEYLIAEETSAANLASAEADLQNTKITLEKTNIRASDDGVITSRSATLGTVVSSGSELFRLLRQNRVEWDAEVNAQQLAVIKPEQKAVITLAGGQQIEGRVRVASPTLNATTGRAAVYVRLDDPAASAGSFANGDIEIGSQKALTVPQSAVVLRDGRSYVFTLNNDNTVARRVVTTGRYRESRIEILGGIDAAMRVVESGGAFLSEGSPITVAQ
jgi:RND family efflux transporter MFP subunit